jgi:hypothetical protein
VAVRATRRAPGWLGAAPSYKQRLFRRLPLRLGGVHPRGVNKINITLDEHELLAQLLRARGRQPAGFKVEVQADGLVRVSGPRGTAFYSRDNWLARFSRHLEKSFFDPEVPAPAGPRLERKGDSRLAEQA